MVFHQGWTSWCWVLCVGVDLLLSCLVLAVRLGLRLMMVSGVFSLLLTVSRPYATAIVSYVAADRGSDAADERPILCAFIAVKVGG